MPELLFLVSSARELPLAAGGSHPTGFFAEEALTPWERFTAAGLEPVVATPDGASPYADPYGLEELFHYPDADEDFLAAVVRSFHRDPDDIRVTLHQRSELGLIAARRVYQALVARGRDRDDARALVNRAARTAWARDRPFGECLLDADEAGTLGAADVARCLEEVLADARAESARVAATLADLPGFRSPRDLRAMSDEEMARFDAVFVPGGHGPMVDLADNPDVTRLLRVLHERGATIAALCHGPALLLAAPARADGEWLFEGYRLTAFTDEEETQTPAGRQGMAWFLETALRNAGAVFDDGRQAWASHVVVDRHLITAQNPDSATAVADAVLKALGAL